MAIVPVLNQIIILFLLLFVGFTARKMRLIHGDVNHQLSDLMLTFFLPCTVVSSFLHNNIQSVLSTGLQVLALGFVLYLATIVIGYFLFRKLEPGPRRVLWFSTVFSNSGFMGYPVLDSVFGPVGVMYGAFFNINFSLFLWTFGFALFSGARDVKMLRNVATNPGLLSIAAGLLLSYLPVSLPDPLIKSVDILGGLTTPLAMLVIGSTLAEIRFRDVFSGVHIYIISVIRLLLLPVATLVVLRLCGVTGLTLGVAVIAIAMPIGTSTVLFARKFNGDVHLATRSVFLSTAASMLTVPLILLLLGFANPG